MNKKGNMVLRFLTVLLITVMFFSFAGCVVSKFFRLSTQAKDNFADLAVEVIKVQSSATPLTKPFVLIQDKDTYVYFVTDKTRRQLMNFDDEVYELKYPADCEKVNCLCLCREYEDGSAGVSAGSSGAGTPGSVRKCKDFTCKQLPGVSIAPGTEVIAYREEEQSRRQYVSITKCAENSPYCRGRKGDVSIIFNSLDEKGFYRAIS